MMRKVILILSFLNACLVSSQIVPFNRNQVFERAISQESDLQLEKALSQVLNYETIFNSLKELGENLESKKAPLPNITIPCLMEALTIYNGIKTSQIWAIAYVDSFPKPPSGTLLGNILWNGDYHECNSIPSLIYDPKTKLTTKYCRLGKPNDNPLVPVPSITLGICTPGQCNPHDIIEIINYAIDNLPKNITNLVNVTNIDPSYITCAEDKLEFDTGAYVAITITSIIGALVLVSTVYDIYSRHVEELQRNLNIQNDKNEEKSASATPKPLFWQVLLSFSIYTNSLKLFTVTKVPGQIDCLHGIRFLSIAWVILGHTYLFSSFSIQNPLTAIGYQQRFTFQIISNAFFSVDSFFMISGLLTSFLFLKEMAKRDGKITLPIMANFYIHRIWRITPPYMLVIMFTGCLEKYMRSGPVYPVDGFELKCQDNWWTNLLYINNFWVVQEQCLVVSWYLANDMQFHWISPILLIPFVLGKKNVVFKYIGYILSGVLIVTNGVIIAAILAARPDIKNTALDPDFSSLIYIKPWCRIAPFVVGILLGYALHVTKSNPNFKINRYVNIIGWLVSLFTMGILLFGLYPDFEEGVGHGLNKAVHILYQSSSRALWAMALAFMVFSCTMGKGGIVNDILSWPVWIPLSRLSFCAYLIHVEFIYYFLFTQEKPLFMQDINLAYYYIGNIMFSYVGAFFVSMLFEVPMLGLEKFVFKKH